VTGLGMVSPVGLTVGESWANVLAGRSGISAIERFDVSGFATRIGGSVKGFEVTDFIPEKEAKKMDIFIHYGIAAGCQAIEDAQLSVEGSCDGDRIGVAIGAGIGGITGIEDGHSAFLKGGARRISPFFVPSNIINMISGNLSIKYGLRGPNIAIVTACATGTHNIGEAARIIRCGDADIMVAGGAEMATSPTSLGGFASARALSRRNEEPERASRPWDRDRDGFVLSDGAGVVVLEELEHALNRDAPIYGELIGYGASSDAYHMTQPLQDGEGAARCMALALRNAELNPDDIDYINAHGTSTPAGDAAETQAIKTAFGDKAYRVPISSTKSMTGHMLGAAGGVEAIFSILALRDQVIPPTINLETPDPECDLDYVPGVARAARLNVAMSNSFGFGGTNGTLIFKRWH
jgi:3-oxoacyl-[acyl-carrier-protein] synthase II